MRPAYMSNKAAKQKKGGLLLGLRRLRASSLELFGFSGASPARAAWLPCFRRAGHGADPLGSDDDVCF
jgi:hypothetical protein